MHKSNIPVGSQDSDQAVYEVIRVIDGISLFLEDHFNRLRKSMEIQGILLEMEFQEFKKKITELVMLNRKTEGNIKFEYSNTESDILWAFSFIPHSYPTSEDYQNGVNTDLLFAEREKPNAKVVQNTVRESSNQMIFRKKLYEVLLVERSGLITEGSRSNVFFVKGEVFYTAPATSVLMGITRQKALDCLKELSFHVIEEAIHTDEISRFDAVFLTGTSPKVLPVRSIGDQIFNTKTSAVKQLIEHYDNLINQYLHNGKASVQSDD